MGGRRGGRQVRAKMELRPKKDDPEEQRQNADMPTLGLHVLTKTKLRLEWLQGQVPLRLGEMSQLVVPA